MNAQPPVAFPWTTETIVRFLDPTAQIGDGTKLWHFCVVLADVIIGDHCNIGSHCEIGRGSVIGNASRIGNGVFLPPNSRLGEGVFIGPGTVFTDDRYPIVQNSDYEAEPPTVEDHASIGAGAVILPGVVIGHHAMIGAGSVITEDVPPNTIIRGEPSRIIRSSLPVPSTSNP